MTVERKGGANWLRKNERADRASDDRGGGPPAGRCHGQSKIPHFAGCRPHFAGGHGRTMRRQRNGRKRLVRKNRAPPAPAWQHSPMKVRRGESKRRNGEIWIGVDKGVSLAASASYGGGPPAGRSFLGRLRKLRRRASGRKEFPWPPPQATAAGLRQEGVSLAASASYGGGLPAGRSSSKEQRSTTRDLWLFIQDT